MLSSIDRKRIHGAFPAVLAFVLGMIFITWLLEGGSQNGTITMASSTNENSTTETNTLLPSKSAPQRPIPSGFLPGEQPAWIILLTVNNGFFDFFQNWMAYYNRLDITREDVGIVIVAYDDVVLEKIRFFNDTLPPQTIVFSSEASVHTTNSTDFTYGTYGFKKLMSNRANIVLGQLHKGSNIILIDLDIVLLKDPFPYLIDPIDNHEYDMLVQFDRDWEHSPKAARKQHIDTYCAGLFAVAANERVLAFMKDWQDRLLVQPTMNQKIFNIRD